MLLVTIINWRAGQGAAARALAVLWPRLLAVAAAGALAASSQSMAEAANTREKASGDGNLQTRLKSNPWGKEDGKTAIAAMPLTNRPLSESSLRDGKMTWIAVFVLGCDQSRGLDSAVMTEVDSVSKCAESVNSITFEPQYRCMPSIRHRLDKDSSQGALSARLLSLALLAEPAAAPPSAKPKRNVNGIMDNSFLVEEAYNQEAGVVQHIFGAYYGQNKLRGPDDKSLNLAFTQEWPVYSQTHQFSYTVPYAFGWNGGQSSHGVGDILLNYRYQAHFNEDTLTAFAPRLSLVLPTGDAAKGFGDNSWGYQMNLPFSTTLGGKWFVHANAGLTFLPNAGASPRTDLLHNNVGASVIYAAKSDLHFMLEWIANVNHIPRSVRGTGSAREFESLISPGVRKAFSSANGSQLVIGIASPIGLTAPAPDFGVFLYFSFEHVFKKQK